MRVRRSRALRVTNRARVVFDGAGEDFGPEANLDNKVLNAERWDRWSHVQSCATRITTASWLARSDGRAGRVSRPEGNARQRWHYA